MVFIMQSLVSHLRLRHTENQQVLRLHGFALMDSFSRFHQRRFLSGEQYIPSPDRLNNIKNIPDLANTAQSKLPPARSPFSTWVKWVLGSVVALALPFLEKRWKGLLKLEGEVELAAAVAENIAEVVEKVATAAEKVSPGMAEKLPEKGKLKDELLLVEHVSHEAAEDAHLAIDIIHKVDEIKEEAEMIVESFFEAGKVDKDGEQRNS